MVRTDDVGFEAPTSGSAFTGDNRHKIVASNDISNTQSLSYFAPRTFGPADMYWVSNY
jgi:hypothetical protein